MLVSGALGFWTLGWNRERCIIHERTEKHRPVCSPPRQDTPCSLFRSSIALVFLSRGASISPLCPPLVPSVFSSVGLNFFKTRFVIPHSCSVSLYLCVHFDKMPLWNECPDPSIKKQEHHTVKILNYKKKRMVYGVLNYWCKQHFNVAGNPGDANIKDILLGIYIFKSYIFTSLFLLCICAPLCCCYSYLLVSLSPTKHYKLISMRDAIQIKSIKHWTHFIFLACKIIMI